MTRVISVAGAIVMALGWSAAIAAGSPIALQWEDLMPHEGDISAASGDGLGGVVQHGQMTPIPETADPDGLVTDYNGQQVRIPGYVLPLEVDRYLVREFLLVPYVGACIHVPPPPANQIIHVNSPNGVSVNGMYEAVWVTGTINTASISNELADIGYEIDAELVEPYE